MRWTSQLFNSLYRSVGVVHWFVYSCLIFLKIFLSVCCYSNQPARVMNLPDISGLSVGLGTPTDIIIIWLRSCFLIYLYFILFPIYLCGSIRHSAVTTAIPRHMLPIVLSVGLCLVSSDCSTPPYVRLIPDAMWPSTQPVPGWSELNWTLWERIPNGN